MSQIRCLPPGARYSMGALFAAWAVVSLSAAGVLDRSLVDRFRDRKAQVYGKYAVIPLPVRSGQAIWNPTAIRFSPSGQLFAANYTGEIYRLVDTDGDGLEDTARPFCDVKARGLRYPTSLLFVGSDLYVGTAQEIHIYINADGEGKPGADRTFVTLPHGEYPFDWTFGLCRAADGSIFASLATDSYDPSPPLDAGRWRGSLLRIAPDGSQAEVYASGLRFAYGAAINRQGDLFFSDNEGGGNPTEEINQAVRGAFYGHHPAKFGNPATSGKPLVRVTEGRGMAGLCFNSVTNDFQGTAGDLFAACWGPDFAYEEGSIIRVRLRQDADGSYFAQEFPVVRRLAKVVDLAFSPHGDLYVAQFGRDQALHTPSAEPSGGFYRVISADWILPEANRKSPYPRVAGDAQRGSQVFQRLGCVTCHATDGASDSFGPNLAHFGERFTREQVLDAIRNPSSTIRTGYEAVEFQLKDGTSVVGRIESNDHEQVTIRLSGTMTTHIASDRVKDYRALDLSLMPTGLLDGLDTKDLDGLLAFLEVEDRSPGRMERCGVWAYRQVEGFLPGIRFRYKAGAASAVLVLAVVGITGVFYRRRTGRQRE